MALKSLFVTEGESHETTITTKPSRDQGTPKRRELVKTMISRLIFFLQVCQTILSFPVDLDLNKIPAFCSFLNENIESLTRCTLNDEDRDDRSFR